MKDILIDSEFITLGQFLKLVDIIQSGGQAKFFLLEKDVYVNQLKENRRGKKLYEDDIIIVENVGEYRIRTQKLN